MELASQEELAYRKKILEIRGKVVVGKDMTIDMGKGKSYKAKSFKGVVDAILPELQKHHIDLVCKKITTVHAGETHFKAVYQYEFIDLDTGFKELVETVGGGTDRSDKDTGKATTYAMKYLFNSRFLMDSGDDADNESSDRSIDNVTESLHQIIKEMVDTGYFMSPAINPNEDKEAGIAIYKGLGSEIANHLHNAAWLMKKEHELIGLLSDHKKTLK